MLTGIEIITIVGVVAAIISGLDGGGNIAKDLKRKYEGTLTRLSSEVKNKLEKLVKAFKEGKALLEKEWRTLRDRHIGLFRQRNNPVWYSLLGIYDNLLSISEGISSIRPDFELQTLDRLSHLVFSYPQVATHLLHGHVQNRTVPGPLRSNWGIKCPNALSYTSEARSFRDYAIHHSSLKGRKAEECNYCHRKVFFTATQMRYRDLDITIMLSRSGLFRSHCEGSSGWTCLWQQRHAQCLSRFSTVDDLCTHFTEHHMWREARVLHLDWPSTIDCRNRNFQNCGYSLRVGDNEMAMSSDGKLYVELPAVRRQLLLLTPPTPENENEGLQFTIEQGSSIISELHGSSSTIFELQ